MVGRGKAKKNEERDGEKVHPRIVSELSVDGTSVFRPAFRDEILVKTRSSIHTWS